MSMGKGAGGRMEPGGALWVPTEHINVPVTLWCARQVEGRHRFRPPHHDGTVQFVRRWGGNRAEASQFDSWLSLSRRAQCVLCGKQVHFDAVVPCREMRGDTRLEPGEVIVICGNKGRSVAVIALSSEMHAAAARVAEYHARSINALGARDA